MTKNLESISDEIKQVIKSEFEKINRIESLSNGEELFTRKQCKEIFKVSYVTLFNWKKKNILIPFTVGGKVYYRKNDIRNLTINSKASQNDR